MHPPLRPLLRLAPAILVLAACGGAPVAPAPPPAPAVLVAVHAPRLGATLARLSDWSTRFGVPVDARQLARVALAGVLPGARLDGPWVLEAVAGGDDGVVFITLPGDGPVAWQAGRLGDWDVSLRGLAPGRIVVTSDPAWVDAHADWLVARALPADDVDLTLELPSKDGRTMAASLPAAPSLPDASAAERWLDARLWDAVRQLAALRFEVALHRDRLDASLRLTPVPGSALAQVAVPTLSARALAHAPRDAPVLLGLRLPPEGLAFLDQWTRMLADGRVETTDDWRTRLARALGGELMVGLVAEDGAPSLLGAAYPEAPADLARALAELALERAFAVGEREVWRLPVDGQGLYAPGTEASVFGFGPGSEALVRTQLAGQLDTGIAADGDLADAWRRVGAGTCCVALVDLAQLRRLFTPPPWPLETGPPILLLAGRSSGAFTLRLELPAGQMGALLWQMGHDDEDEEAPTPAAPGESI